MEIVDSGCWLKANGPNSQQITYKFVSVYTNKIITMFLLSQRKQKDIEVQRAAGMVLLWEKEGEV